jgi:hypothetical protein
VRLLECKLRCRRGTESQESRDEGMQAEFRTSGVEPAGDWTHDIVRQQRKGIVVVPGACSYDALADHGHQQCGNLDGQHNCA